MEEKNIKHYDNPEFIELKALEGVQLHAFLTGKPFPVDAKEKIEELKKLFPSWITDFENPTTVDDPENGDEKRTTVIS